MQDYLYSFISLFSDSENQLLIMFFSAFLSATLLPGNSEIVFGTIASQQLLLGDGLYSPAIGWLLLSATLGNSLGSMTSYYLARLLPSHQRPQSAKAERVLKWSRKYGAWVLLFSWLPLFGDLFCAAAGWLRLNAFHCLLLITLGKFLRYFALLASLALALH